MFTIVCLFMLMQDDLKKPVTFDSSDRKENDGQVKSDDGMKKDVEAKDRPKEEAAKPRKGISPLVPGAVFAVVSIESTSTRVRALVRDIPSGKTRYVSSGQKVGNCTIVSINHATRSVTAVDSTGRKQVFSAPAKTKP